MIAVIRENIIGTSNCMKVDIIGMNSNNIVLLFQTVGTNVGENLVVHYLLKTSKGRELKLRCDVSKSKPVTV